MRFSRYWILLALCSLLPLTTHAQDWGSKGYDPNKTYDIGNFDAVNLTNGTLNLNILLLTYPQRGTLPPVTISLVGSSSSGGSVFVCGKSSDATDPFYRLHVQISPYLADATYVETGEFASECNPPYSYDIGLIDGTGAMHLLGPSSTSSQWVATDGSYTDNVTQVPKPDGFVNPALDVPNVATDRNGIKYQLPGLPSQNVGAALDRLSATGVTDPSGNSIVYYSSSGSAGYWVDSISRNIPVPSLPTSGCTTVNYPGEGSGTIPLTFCTSSSGLTSVTLPNSTSWSFTYNGVDDIASITVPTGATISYQYEELPSCGIGGSGAYNYAVISRTINLNDGSAPQVWSYSYSARGTTTTTTVTDPDGNDTVHTFTAQSGGSFGPEGCALYETLTQYYSGSSANGSLLKTVTTAYSNAGDNPLTRDFQREGQVLGVFPTTITTTWPADGKVMEETRAYDTSNEGGIVWFATTTNPISIPVFFQNLSQSQVYDYGNGSPGPLLRKTNYTYQWQNNSTYLSANMLDLPSSVTTYDGSGNQVASTTYGYDENNGSPQGVYGNQTSATRWLSGGTSPKIQTVYNGLGMPTEKIDPKGNITTTTYDSTGLFPNQIQYPTTNGVQHIEKFVYDSGTGLMTQHTDQNGQPTNYGYDTIRRPLSVTYPDGGSESYTYNDSTPNPSFSYKRALNSSQNYVAIGIADGLGRMAHTQVTSDPAGTVYTDTTYDDLGRVQSVSNPYRTTGDPTYGITSYSYDPLNRKIFQCQPDNSSMASTTCTPNASYQAWTYNGNVVEFRDESGNQWQQTSDGLGRLITVLEPNASKTPAIETDYQYDPLGNLTKVNQLGAPSGSLQRSFIYDSLSRLISGSNPEAGTVNYTYDANGNVLTKTDARGIAITYSYDALNRLLGKTYSDTTYPVSYTYDTSSGPSPTNTIGRLTDEKTMVQMVPMTERAIDQYDSMGRILSERQCFVGGCGGTAYTLTHSYDLAGNMTGSNNGVTGANAVTLTYGYDGANRLQSVNSTLNPASYPMTLFQATQYSAIGLTQANYGVPTGGSAAFSQVLSYDNRTRLTGETDSTQAPTSLYSYSVGYFPNSNVQNLTNDSQMGSWSYGYDSVNRLSTATATAGTFSGLTLTETYDALGNRTVQTPSGTYTGPVPEPSLLTFTGNNNRVDQWSYDAAGDVLNDTNNMYEYDAEGRQTGVLNALNGLTGYVYDAEGRRAMKVVVTGFGGPDPTTTVQNEYLLGLNGEQVTVLGQNAAWQWTNVYAAGKQLATYNGSETYFPLTDWLGSKRMEVGVQVSGTTATATIDEQCTNMPFGDGQNCSGTDVNQLHFTGKERDTESNNDYFGARYYASTMGRFMNPDKPFADQHKANPQSWNLYAYARNNPLKIIDPNGEAAVIVVNGNNVTIYFPVSFSGNAATPANEGAYTTAITSAWTGQFGNYNTTMHVVPGDPSGPLTNDVNINDPTPANGAFPRPTTDVGGPNMNLFGLGDNAAQNDYEKWASGHEAGHGMGEQDQYHDTNGQSVPNPGYENNIMGAVNGTPNAHDINNIVAFPGNNVINITPSAPLNTETATTNELIQPTQLQPPQLQPQNVQR